MALSLARGFQSEDQRETVLQAGWRNSSDTQKKAPRPVDKHVGSRVRMRRKMLGISQEKLGKDLVLTFQKVQKYEKGANRIGASRLQQISHILQIPVEFLFEGMPDASLSKSEGRSLADINDFVSSADGLRLVAAFTHIKNADVRRRIVGLVQEIADDGL
jgi:transcriptional regulator with XRE-family HTH domain